MGLIRKFIWAQHGACRLDSRHCSRLFLSSDSSTTGASSSVSVEWRKSKLDQLERKFTGDSIKAAIQSDVELQPEWKAMESRVTKRRTLTVEERQGKTGRTNIRRTEEDVWMENGLYSSDDKKSN
jgi:iron uptake system EfeUOB component EfeO/EfeM